jgi:hypothetical protein
VLRPLAALRIVVEIRSYQCVDRPTGRLYQIMSLPIGELSLTAEPVAGRIPDLYESEYDRPTLECRTDNGNRD